MKVKLMIIKERSVAEALKQHTSYSVWIQPPKGHERFHNETVAPFNLS